MISDDRPTRSDTRSWRRRWLQLGGDLVLHRVGWSMIEWTDWSIGTGRSACGRVGEYAFPGIFSRMEAPRCPECCRAVSVAEGVGNPRNGK